MAEEITRSIRCDVPGCGRLADHAEIVVHDEAHEVDLCDTHDKPLIELAALGRPVRGQSRRVRRDRARDTSPGRLERLIVDEETRE